MSGSATNSEAKSILFWGKEAMKSINVEDAHKVLREGINIFRDLNAAFTGLARKTETPGDHHAAESMINLLSQWIDAAERVTDGVSVDPLAELIEKRFAGVSKETVDEVHNFSREMVNIARWGNDEARLRIISTISMIIIKDAKLDVANKRLRKRIRLLKKAD